MYSKKYGIFAWIKDPKTSEKILVGFNNSFFSKKEVKIYYCAKYIHLTLNYYKQSFKYNNLELIDGPFIVRITNNQVKMKSGILKLNWRKVYTVQKYGHQAVPFNFIKN